MVERWSPWIMMKCLLGLAVLSTFLRCLKASQAPEEKEYCMDEYFNAACTPNHVIMMDSAVYGRMDLGRCVKNDYGHLGCSADVLAYMDSQCSGRSQCEFQIYTSQLRQMTMCPEELASYLKATYSCLKVTLDRGPCLAGRPLTMNGTTGYISSMSALDKNYGTTECPWRIQAQPGQTIKLNMLKYAAPLDALAPGGPCYEVATLSEGTTIRERITTCDVERKGLLLYESIGSQLEVKLVGSNNLVNLGNFVMQYQVTGCSNIKVPVNATWIRKGLTLEVRCNNTDRTWFLVCKGDRWAGDLGNCSLDIQNGWGIGDIIRDSILVVVAIGVALGIFCGGLLLTCAYMYMKRRRSEHRANLRNTGQETEERFIVPEESFPPPPEDFLHHQHHHLSNYTDVHLKGHEECFLHAPCTDSDKQISLVYTKTKTLKPGIGTVHGRHLYETPKFV